MPPSRPTSNCIFLLTILVFSLIQPLYIHAYMYVYMLIYICMYLNCSSTPILAELPFTIQPTRLLSLFISIYLSLLFERGSKLRASTRRPWSDFPAPTERSNAPTANLAVARNVPNEPTTASPPPLYVHAFPKLLSTTRFYSILQNIPSILS